MHLHRMPFYVDFMAPRKRGTYRGQVAMLKQHKNMQADVTKFVKLT